MKRRKSNPAKFDRCVSDVRRSLAKAGRAGNAFAICQSSRRSNPTRWNPILPLDVWTATMTPNVLAGIEKEREKIARSFGRKKRKNASVAYEAGKRALRAGAARHGTVNLTPSIAQREEWGHAWGEFMRGWNAAKKEKVNAGDYSFRKSKKRKNGPNWRTAGSSVGKQDKAAYKHGFSLRGIRSTFSELWNQAVANGHQNTSSAAQRKALASFTAGYDRSFKTRVNAGDYSFRKSKKRMKSAGLFGEMVLRRHSGGDKVKRIPKQFRKHPGAKRNPANPVPAAEQRYQSFHGRPSERLVKVRTTLHTHDVLAGIGDLRKLRIKSANGHWKVTVKFSKPYPILSMNEDATQLYIEGGDQSVSLKDFGIKTAHEKEVLGEVTDVWYFTTKDHLRPQDGGTAVYHHKFGRIKPTMIYDVPNQLLEFAGGGYTIPDEGIDQ
jgi:hypothetical protein